MRSNIVVWAALVAGLWGLAGCEDAGPSASPSDGAGGSDVADITEATDTAVGTDASGDSLTGGSDAAPDIQPPEDVTSLTCAAPCVDDDNNPCTVALCENGSCVKRTVANGSSCDDGNPCTIGDTCQSGTCAAGTAEPGEACGCETNADCSSLDDALACNGQYFCDKSVFPFSCKVNPASIPPCDTQTPPTPCLTGACEEPATTGGKATCTWKVVANGTGCDDGNPLTSGDVCFQGACVSGQFVGSCQSNADCGQYEDGNFCNGQLFCNKAKGQCQVNPATVVVCPTGGDSLCSHNTCQPATGKCAPMPTAEGEACDDSNDCTTGETCASGSCAGGTNACSCASDADCVGQEDGNLCNGTLFCNLQLGQCQLNPATVVVCGAASEPCQALECQPATGKCASVAADDGAPCNADNNLCTLADTCVAGACQAGENLCKCTKTSDCALFNDADQCNGQLYCNLQKGACELNPATVITCDAGLETPCARQVCVPLSGECTAVAQNEGGGCDDGDSCTLGDTCAAGSCTAGSSVCACKTDSDCADEEDGNACNGTLFCDKVTATCKLNPASIVACLDPNPTDCMGLACQPATGLCADVSITTAVACDDDDPCTASTKCSPQAVCSGGIQSCGCSSDFECAAQDDGDPCNGVARCDFSVFPVAQCKIVAPEPCEDGVCVERACDPESGECISTPLVGFEPCDDGDPCSGEVWCIDGTCTGEKMFCDDAEPCTLDWCAGGVCQHKKLTDKLPCEDGEACTVVDYCDAGVCIHVQKKCDDETPCTTDGCTDGVCFHLPNSDTCDDGDQCTEYDACKGGTCSGTPVDCSNLADQCQIAMCVAASGCVVLPGKEGFPCSDGEVCTYTAACKDGTCQRTSKVVCNDGDPCTTDPSCEEKTGCVVQEEADGNPLTYWEVVESDQTAWWWGLTSHPKTDQIAALSNGSGNDPLLRVWAPGGQTHVEYTLSFPGGNEGAAVIDDNETGWLVVGSNTNQNSGSVQTYQPLLMRVDQDGQLLWVSANLASHTSLYAVSHLPTSDPNHGKHVMVAGKHLPGGASDKAQMWIGEVDISGLNGPTLIRSGTCGVDDGGLAGQIRTVYGTSLAAVGKGHWVVSGGLETTPPQWYTMTSAALCRFDADLKQVGETITPSSNSDSLGVFARPEGGFWWFDGNQNWWAYDSEGYLVRRVDHGGWISDLEPEANGAWIGYGGDGNWSLSFRPFGGSSASNLDVTWGDDGQLYDIARDSRGLVILYQSASGLHLQHFDDKFYPSCSDASDCKSLACSQPQDCMVGRCQSGGGCVSHEIACNDNNPCTSDSCSATGCVHTPLSQVACDDDAACTLNDVCEHSKCVGSSTLGQSIKLVPSTEKLADGVAYGDGLVVVGTRTTATGVETFWRRYNSSREAIAEGVVAPAAAIRMGHSAAALRWTGGFASGDKLSVAVASNSGGARLWLLDVVQGTALDLGDVGPAGAELSAVVHDEGDVVHLVWIEELDAVWTRYTPGEGHAEIQRLNNVDATYDAHLLPISAGWLFAQTGAYDGTTLRLLTADANGMALGPVVSHYFEVSPESPGAMCLSGVVKGGVEFVCRGDVGVFFSGQSGASPIEMPNALEAVQGAGLSPLLSTRSNVTLTLQSYPISDAWSLIVHDGFFNASTQRFGLVADRVPVFTGSFDHAWVVAETAVGANRELQIWHLDHWGNTVCSDSLGCEATNCDDGNACTMASCTAGSCSSSVISPSGNCGSDGPCQYCTTQ